ncbi:hypothetical protein EV356DRAFT_534755 [Viridothelium virens]|uniref:Uncharacterized protein n=1 Tax=Viridothelium virens TaxID=1048519 RepID=A0A6A6H336_VIRVR|nr:hypothetical protein EV356DRAFT_534755 [Viridothelium virens]
MTMTSSSSPAIVAPLQLPMCYYRLNIFTHCGHTSYSPLPPVACPRASFPPESHHSETCIPKAHPFQTLRVEGNCGPCERKKEERFTRVFGGDREHGGKGGEGEEEAIVERIKVEEWKWKVRYAAPKREEGGRGELEMDLGRMKGPGGEGRREESGGVADDEGKEKAKRISGLRKIVRWRWKKGSWRTSDASRLSLSMKSPSLKSPRWS